MLGKKYQEYALAGFFVHCLAHTVIGVGIGIRMIVTPAPDLLPLFVWCVVNSIVSAVCLAFMALVYRAQNRNA